MYPDCNYGDPKKQYKLIWYDPMAGAIYCHYYDWRRDLKDVRKEIDFMMIDQRTGEVLSTQGNTLRIAMLIIKANRALKRKQRQRKATHANSR